MTLHSRRLGLAFFALTLSAVLLCSFFPVSWPSQAPGNGIALGTAWAGGSPDETLSSNPGTSTSGSSTTTTTNPKKTSPPEGETRLAAKFVTPDAAVRPGRVFWSRFHGSVLWRLTIAFALRF